MTVTGEAELVNTTPSSTSGLVAEQQVKDLPLNGRSFDTLITLNPSTANTTSYRSSTILVAGRAITLSFPGTAKNFNLFTLNGIEYTGVSTADVSPGGVSGQLLGVDAVREFNVLENTYGAEYGKRPGGQVSVVTQSGSNSFHGSVSNFYATAPLMRITFSISQELRSRSSREINSARPLGDRSLRIRHSSSGTTRASANASDSAATAWCRI